MEDAAQTLDVAVGGREAFGSDVTTGFSDLAFRMRKKHKTREAATPCPPLESSVGDTHVHLSMLRDPVFNLARASAYGVGYVCCITNPTEDADFVYDHIGHWHEQSQALVDDFEDAGKLPEGTTPCYIRFGIACGCHPHDADKWDADVENNLRQHLADPRTCCVGEVGLDFHYDYSPRPVQRDVFRRQIELAHETGLPIALHLREAHDEGLAIMDEMGFPEAGCILHCFNLGPDVLAPWVERGCHIAVGGAVTFGSSDDLRCALALIPPDRLLFETDGPFMAPNPFRGCEAGPEHVIYTAEAIAAQLGKQPGEQRKTFLEQVMRNTLELLDRGATPWQHVSS